MRSPLGRPLSAGDGQRTRARHDGRCRAPYRVRPIVASSFGFRTPSFPLTPFDVVAILVTAAAASAYLNYRYLRLHPSVGIMLMALVASVAWQGLAAAWPPAGRAAVAFTSHIDLNDALLHWMLGALLFAGALRVDLSELRNQRAAVVVLSVLGTPLSTVMVAGLSYGLLRLGGVRPPLVACAIFGAVVSPTDPVAVLGFMKQVDAPKDTEAIIAGESLFNDGVGVVLFTVLAGVAGGRTASVGGVAWAFVRQTAGGAGVGLVAGFGVYQLLKRVNNYQVEVLLTLALALGGYALADAVGTSGPIAAVVAGILIGNHGRAFAVSDETRHHLDDFWELIDEALNAVLFLLVGLVTLNLHVGRRVLAAQAAAVALVLVARWASVAASAAVVSVPRWAAGPLRRHTVAILTWGGLRGGLAIAMALSLPAGPQHDLIVAATYGVVVFSVLVQGTTLRPMFARFLVVHRA